MHLSNWMFHLNLRLLISENVNQKVFLENLIV